VGDTGTVQQVASARWGVQPAPAIARFAEAGWSYEEPVVRPCPRCAGPLHSLRKPYVSAGKTYRYVALVCPACPASFTLADVGAKVYGDVMKPLAGDAAGPVPSPVADGGSGSTLSGGVRNLMRAVGRRLRPGPAPDDGYVVLSPLAEETLTVAGRQVIVGPAEHACGDDLSTGVNIRVIAAGGWPGVTASPPPPPRVVAERALHWVKLTDPTAWRGAPTGADVRVLLPDDDRTATLQARLAASGVPFRAVRYWVEDETVATTPGLELTARARPCTVADRFSTDVPTLVGPSAAAARDAFDLVWQANAPLPASRPSTPRPNSWCPPRGCRCCRTRRSTRHRPR